MPTLDADSTGARIKEQRRLARLTQKQLADRLPYSYSLLNPVHDRSSAPHRRAQGARHLSEAELWLLTRCEGFGSRTAHSHCKPTTTPPTAPIGHPPPPAPGTALASADPGL
ncbi:hypothetical protein [Streptomyces wuyuanensis]|uniref:hypothetical protein n=1 Tax=Streptomyces wuyuanensis TaxID=1196353 RepID=UPI003D7453ED